MKLHPLWLIFSFSMLIACQPSNPKKQTVFNQQQLDSLTLQLNAIQKAGAIQGFGVAIVNADSVVYEKGFGYADRNIEVPYTKYSLQNIASISKTLIGIALLKAQEMGKLDLDDPIDKYLSYQVVNPNFPEARITIRQLAAHTSSIRDSEVYSRESYVMIEEIDTNKVKDVGIPSSFNAPEKHTDMNQFLEKVLSENGEWYHPEIYLKKEPGSFFEYSNIGATLAAAVIEAATGTPYDQFTDKHILKSLGMNASGWSFQTIDRSNHSQLYGNSETRFPFYTLITYPDGGLITSIHDMGLYLQELILAYQGKGRLLESESYRQLFTPALEESHFDSRDSEFPYNDEYNYGIFMGHTPIGYIGHTGGDPGVSTFMFFDPKKSIGWMLFINTDLNSDEDVNQLFAIWDALRSEA